MAAGMLSPATPPGGFPRLRDGEFHPISSRLVADYTDVFCDWCGALEHTGHGLEGAVAHGAEHAIVTGHTVTERHTRVTVVTARPPAREGR